MKIGSVQMGRIHAEIARCAAVTDLTVSSVLVSRRTHYWRRVELREKTTPQSGGKGYGYFRERRVHTQERACSRRR
jgi:hypothetical protein